MEATIELLNKFADAYRSGAISQTAFIFKCSGALDFAESQQLIDDHESSHLFEQAKDIGWSKYLYFSDPVNDFNDDMSRGCDQFHIMNDLDAQYPQIKPCDPKNPESPYDFSE